MFLLFFHAGERLGAKPFRQSNPTRAPIVQRGGARVTSGRASGLPRKFHPADWSVNVPMPGVLGVMN